MEKLFDLQTEADVLTICLSHPEHIYEALDALTVDHFYNGMHRRIFAAIAELTKESVEANLVTVNQRLKEKDIDLQADVIRIATNFVPAPSLPFLMERVVQLKIARGLWELSHQAIGELEDNPVCVDRLIEEFSTFAVDSVNTSVRDKPVIVGELFEDFHQQLEERYNNGITPGLSTTFASLDEYTALHPGQLILIAARPSMGKSALALQMAYSLALQGKTTLFFSLEMSRDQLISRLVSFETQIFHDKLERPSYMEPSGTVVKRLTQQDWKEIARAQGVVGDAPLVIADKLENTINRIGATCHQIRAQQKSLDLIVIDYLQLINPANANNNRNDQIGEISRSLKMLAKKMDCPVVALSQLSRGLESRPNKRPLLSDLRDSGCLEQDADTVFFVYRDEYYKEDSPDKGKAEIIIAKQRQGPLATVKLAYRGNTVTFMELEEKENASNYRMDFRPNRQLYGAAPAMDYDN